MARSLGLSQGVPHAGEAIALEIFGISGGQFGHAVMTQGEGQTCIEDGSIRRAGLGESVPELIGH